MRKPVGRLKKFLQPSLMKVNLLPNQRGQIIAPHEFDVIKQKRSIRTKNVYFLKINIGIYLIFVRAPLFKYFLFHNVPFLVCYLCVQLLVKCTDFRLFYLVTAEKLLEARIFCSHEDKDHYLYYFLLRHPGRTIIFCNSIDCVLRLVKFLNILKLNPLGLHSSMNQKHRFQNLER